MRLQQREHTSSILAKNLAGSGDPMEGQLNEGLKAAIINAESQKAEGAETEIDAATEERLRALGYIE